MNISIDKITVENTALFCGIANNNRSRRRGLILLVNGRSDSIRNCCNRRIAKRLNEQGFDTVTADLLTKEEDKDYHNRLDISLLTSRMREILNWVHGRFCTHEYQIGLFASMTGAACAMRLAIEEDYQIRALVSYSGRPDLALSALPQIKSPVLFITETGDLAVLKLNIRAFDLLQSRKKMQVIGQLGIQTKDLQRLNIISELTAEWFGQHFPPISNHVKTQRQYR